MDSSMTFNSHIDEMHRKVYGTLIYLNRIWERFDQESRVMVVRSLVLSILNYCLCVWGSASKTQMSRVQKLQNFAARVAIGGIRKHEHVTPLYDKLGWLRMDDKFLFDICLLIYKMKNRILPEWLFILPTVNQRRNETMITRNRDCYFVPRTFTDIGARAVTVLGPKSWNVLPVSLKQCLNISTFKSKLSKHLKTK